MSLGHQLRAVPHEPQPAPAAPPEDRLAMTEARVEKLEAALEGLQDAVYRDAQRHERELAELRREIQPARLAQSLSQDARERGL